MTALDHYLEPIKVAGESQELQYRAYRIDGNLPAPDMRRDAGLGTCNSCDYFIFDANALILIEDTQLAFQIKNLRKEYRYLDLQHQKEFIGKYIRDENKLKVYGSLLVLCKWAARHESTEDLLEKRRLIFWLVASGMETEEDSRFLDNLRDQLLRELQSVLSGHIVDGVEILPGSVFERRLSEVMDQSA